MSQKEIQKLVELAEQKLRQPVSKEAALETFINAGILNEEAQFTKEYEDLNLIIKQK